MFFAGRDIQQIYKAKATKFDISYYTDFEHQELVDDGRIISAIEAPTIRQIDVDILLKAESKEMLDYKLREMVDWLLSSGTDKLYSDKDASRYYMARCTKIERPEFRGRAAILHVVFTCRDCRPYDASTGQPIGNIYANASGRPDYFSNFTFKGKHCLNDYSCVFVMESFSFLPEVRRNAYEITGRSGTIRYDAAPMLKERTLSGWLYFVNSSKVSNDPDVYNSEKPLTKSTTMADHMHGIASWLINSRRASFIFDSDTTREYQAEVISKGELDYSGWANGRLKVEFILQPYSQNITAATETIELDVEPGVATSDVFTFINSGAARSAGFPTPIVFSIKNKFISGGSSSDYVDLNLIKIIGPDENGKSTTFILSGDKILPAPATIGGVNYYYRIVIDGRDCTVKLSRVRASNGVETFVKDLTQYIQSGDFPHIYPTGSFGWNFIIDDATAIASGLSNVSAEITVTASANTRWI